MKVKSEIISSLKAAIADLSLQGETLGHVEPVLQTPKDQSHGDYASNIALTLFKDKGLMINDKFRTPMDLANAVSDKLNTSSLIPNPCSRVEAAPPGFINFWLSKDYLINNLQHVLNKKEYSSKPQDSSKKVVVEYSSPNIAKPFTVGHLRSTIIGDAIANLLQANGWKVYRDNHLGDWGTQFGKQIYAVKTWGSEKKIEKSQNPVKELVDLYVKFHEEAEKNPKLEEKGREWFKKLEDGDKEARRLWKKCVEWSLKEFKTIYQKLGVEFTENNGLGFGESFFADKIQDVLQELQDKKLLKESEGAKLVFFESFDSASDKYPPLMIMKKDGATLYSTRDLATDKFRLKKYGKDVVIINEVGIEQTLYFKQLFEIEKMLGWFKEGQRIHKRHGHYRFKDEKMSTRKGNTIWLEDVLEEAIKRAEKLGSIGQKIAETVGIGAIKWNDLKRTSEQDIVFDWDEILNMQGDSGPYLQYTYARTQSVLSKSEIRNPKSEINSKSKNPNVKKVSNFDIRYSNLNLQDEEVVLLRTINRFEEVIEEAGEKFSPNLLCNYLFDLAQKFNLFYQKHKILSVSLGVKLNHLGGVQEETQEFRVALTSATGIIIKNGLNLLGIQTPEKM